MDSKTSDPHRLLLNLSDKINLKRSEKKLLYQTLLYMEYIKKSCTNNKFKVSVATWNEEFELPDGANYVSDIQGYFEYIIKIMRQLLIILQ